MNITKIFFTLVFSFSISFVAQANNTTPATGESAEVAVNKEVKINQVEENVAIGTNTQVPAKSNKTNIITINTETNTEQTESLVFSFNHKQFLKPVFKKSALC
ncbi:MAG: hypothetical protein AAFZ15_14710 [Bacteroidota bacterium]